MMFLSAWEPGYAPQFPAGACCRISICRRPYFQPEVHQLFLDEDWTLNPQFTNFRRKIRFSALQTAPLPSRLRMKSSVINSCYRATRKQVILWVGLGIFAPESN
jgi:hypothetical protein